MKLLLIAALLSSSTLLRDCEKAEALTPISQQVVDAGAGNPIVLDQATLTHWFHLHPNLAARIAQECQTSYANRSNNTELKVCSAAGEAAFFKTAKAGRDGVSF